MGNIKLDDSAIQPELGHPKNANKANCNVTDGNRTMEKDIYPINPHDLAEWLTEMEVKKTASQVASDLYKTRGKDFCTAVALHLIMYVTGNYKD